MTGHEALQEARGTTSGQLSIRGVVITFIALVTLSCVAFVLMWVYLIVLKAPQARNNAVELQPATVRPPLTPLDPFQEEQKTQYLASQARLLGSYGWIDEKQKLAHIPIDEAMQKVIQQYQGGKQE